MISHDMIEISMYKLNLYHHQFENSSRLLLARSFQPSLLPDIARRQVLQMASRVIYMLVNVGVMRSSNRSFAAQWVP